METTNLDQQAPARPQFLTVLCILTYIGVGIGIIGSIVGWWGMHIMESMMNGSTPMPEGTDLSSMPGMEEAMSKMKYMNVNLSAGIIGCLICLIGALQMWRLKKMGFYIYLLGEVTPMIVSVAVMGSAAVEGWAILSAIIPVIFIVLYTLNLKHLN